MRRVALEHNLGLVEMFAELESFLVRDNLSSSASLLLSSLELSDTKVFMSLKCEPSSEPLHNIGLVEMFAELESLLVLERRELACKRDKRFSWCKERKALEHNLGLVEMLRQCRKLSGKRDERSLEREKRHTFGPLAMFTELESFLVLGRRELACQPDKRFLVREGSFLVKETRAFWCAGPLLLPTRL